MFPLRFALALVSVLCLPALAGTGRVTWELSPGGRLRGLTLPEGAHRAVAAAARLAGTEAGTPEVEMLPGGGVRRTAVVREPVSGARCELAECFEPAGNTLRWTVEVRGLSEQPWSAPIEATLRWPATGETRVWAPWGAYPGMAESAPGWVDPLEPRPLADATLVYGGADHARSDTVSLPLVTLLEPRSGLGLSLAGSADDPLLDLLVTTSRDGTVTFSHRNHRIAPDLTLRFSMDLVLHAPSWRAGLAWYVARYPGWFEPPLPASRALAGCGAYTGYEGELDAARLAAMGFRVNWKASFDFPYMGMFLPPVEREARWKRFGSGETSIAQMNAYAERMHEEGFAVLSYFNVTEFGAYIRTPAPEGIDAVEPVWTDANAYLYRELPGAILPAPGGGPIGTWEGGIVTDCGDPAYRAFLLEQARRHVRELPAADGICIDRMDWLRWYNRTSDDGRSWVDGGPARSVLNSWKSLMADLGRTMHRAGKAIYVNSMTRRIDAMREVDGIYDEHAYYCGSLNACSFLALRKPYIGWTISADNLRPDPDAYFQRNLHMGAFPTAPVPGNDHTIRPDPWSDRYYLDYGPLLAALSERTWCLGPATAAVAGGKAKANLFEIPGGYVAPVTFGGTAERVGLLLEGFEAASGAPRLRCFTIRPGEAEWTDCGWVPTRGLRRVDVRLTRGAAMVKLLHTWMEPTFDRMLGGERAVTMATSVPGAVLRYTLDGSAPTVGSPRYGGPIRLTGKTTVRCAAFAGGRQIGPGVDRTYIPSPLPTPVADPAGGVIVDSLTVRLDTAPRVEGATIRYTLDGSEPTEASSAYGEPLVLTDGCTVAARLFAPGRAPGPLVRHEYRRCPPEPPAPDEFLSDRPAVRATTGWGDAPRTDRAIGGNPLSVAGRAYARGMGVHANSELAYALTGTEREFVATVGVDDEMAGYTSSTVRFEVWVDGARVVESPILRLGQVWHFRVALPAAARELSLRALDADDGMACDHADWVNAGFLRG